MSTESSGHSPTRDSKHVEPVGAKDATQAGVVEATQPPADREEQVKRGLQDRHVLMIAVGGIIGSGFFVGTGGALNTGGPVGLLLGYSAMGLVTYSVITAVGEIASLFPLSGGFVYHASRFFDPALGFAVGWNYWAGLAITVPAELVAGALVIGYWDTTTNVAVWISIFLFAITAVNFCPVRVYGEQEFWMASLKVLSVVGLLLAGIVIDLGGTPTKDRLGFRYWLDPGPFAQLDDIPGAAGRFLAFWSTFLNSAFSFGGVEVIALSAAESNNPHKTVPRAIKTVFWRILIFYVGGTFVIGLTVPYTNPNLLSEEESAVASPFVIALELAGVKSLASVINAVILLSTYSASTSYLYAASRTIYGLAVDRQAPEILARVDKRGVPYVAVAFTALFGCLAYMNLSNSGATVFNWLYTLSAISCILAWIAILITYLRFRAGYLHQGIDLSLFPYRAPLQPYLSYFGLVMLILITFFNGFEIFLAGSAPFDVSNFFASYILIPLYIGAYFFWKFYKKTSIVTLEQMDFSGMRERWQSSDVERSIDDVKKPLAKRMQGWVKAAWE